MPTFERGPPEILGCRRGIVEGCEGDAREGGVRDAAEVGEPEGEILKEEVVVSVLRRAGTLLPLPRPPPRACAPPLPPLGRDERESALGLGSAIGERPKTELLPPTLLPMEDRMTLPGVSPLTSCKEAKVLGCSGEVGGVLSA